MDRIRSQSKPLSRLAEQILRWISFASRPISLTELQHALAVEVGESQFDEGNLLTDEDDMTSCCAGLVIVEPTDKIIRLVHYTTQEYFQRNRKHFFPEAQTEITQVCLTYLLYNDLHQEHRSQDQLYDNYPLIGYAARHWGKHARGEPEQDQIVQRLAVELLEKDDRLSDAFMTNPRPEDAFDPFFNVGWELRKGPRGLHIAASFGLTTILLLLLKRGIDPNQEDKHGEMAIHWACWNGHYEVVQLLIDHKAEVNARAKWNQSTPLIIAAVNGHVSIAELLLDYGAEIDAEWAQKQIGLSALSEACHHNRLEVAQLLLDRGASTSRSARSIRTPMECAARKGHTRIVQLLLSKGASIAGVDGWNALWNAIHMLNVLEL